MNCPNPCYFELHVHAASDSILSQSPNQPNAAPGVVVSTAEVDALTYIHKSMYMTLALRSDDSTHVSTQAVKGAFSQINSKPDCWEVCEHSSSHTARSQSQGSMRSCYMWLIATSQQFVSQMTCFLNMNFIASRPQSRFEIFLHSVRTNF